MVDITTPTPGGDTDTWGVILNTALTTLESAVTSNESDITGRVAKTGDTMTGALTAPRITSTGTMHATGASFGEAQPAAHNLASWLFDPVLATNSSLLTNGTVYLAKMHVSADVSVTKIYWWVATAGATPTANQNVVGIYNSSGTLLASTVVDADISSTGLKTTTISSQALTAGSFYWVGMVFNAATAPTVARMSGLAGVGGAVNVGLTAATFRVAINGTLQTNLPASITPASNAQPAFGGPWAAIGT